MNTDLTVMDITLAVYVEKNKSNHVHVNRRNHGIALNLSSSEKIYVFENEKIIKLAQNEMLYMPKHSSYRIYSETSGECYAINFELASEIPFAPFRFRPKNLSGFQKKFEKASILWKRKNGPYQMQCKALLYEILILMQMESVSEYISGSTSSVIYPAIEYIHKNYTNPELKISDLSELCGISEDYFRKVFKKCHNISPLKYLNDLKLKYAKELLLSGDLPIAKIAEMAGFSDPAYFCREFKKNVGIAPSEY